jgi:hypothetical protein
MGEEGFQLPLLILIVDKQLAIRDNGSPTHLHPNILVANSQILNVVIGSPQTSAHVWQLQHTKVQLRPLVEQLDLLLPVE